MTRATNGANMRPRLVWVLASSVGALIVTSMPLASATPAIPGLTTSLTAVGPSTAVAGPTRVVATKCGTAYGEFRGTASAQHFGSALEVDTFGAKEIRCPGNRAARTISRVTVAGSGRAMDMNFNVAFYGDRAVGAAVRQPPKKRHQPDDNKPPVCSYTDAPGTFRPTGPSHQEWTIALDEPCILSKKIGEKGAWIDVQADLDYGDFGQWYLAVQTAPDVNEGDWRNPDNRYATNCATYAVKPPVGIDFGFTKVLTDCLFGGTGPTDWMVTVA